MNNSVPGQLRDAIRDGTFPDSEEVLSSNLTSDALPRLLQTISQTRQELTEEIRQSSRGQAGDVDEWISQAKKVQEDIARCKIEAKQIVQEHEKLEILRSIAREARQKEELLQEEIDFNANLALEIQHVAETSQNLGKVDGDILEGNYLSAAKGLSQSSSPVRGIASSQSRKLLSDIRHDLQQRLKSSLAGTLEDRLVVRRDDQQVILEIHSDGTTSPSMSNGKKQQEFRTQISTPDLIEAFDNLGESENAISICTRKLEGSLLPYFSRNSKLKAISAIRNEQCLELKLDVHDPSADRVANVMVDVIDFLFEKLPQKGQHQIISKLLVKIVPIFITDWLDAAMPTEIHALDSLTNLQDLVSKLADKLENWNLPGSDDLHRWNNQIPRIWLAKRRMNSLDDVRKAFALARGTTRQVERVEKQMVTLEPSHETKSEEDDDWNAIWDDEEVGNTEPQPTESSEDDDTDAWGFDDSEDQPRKKTTNGAEENNDGDDADAWGWGDENDSPAEEKKPQVISKQRAKSNGIKAGKPPQEQELVLREEYTITDIPDYILQLVGKDMQDAQDLQSSAASFPSLANSAASLANVPMLSLAMFRAVAPNLYIQITPSSSSAPLSYMNLYNDCLYLSSTLSSNFPDSPLSKEAASLTKFARSHYSQSMEVQRTILTDLLDNAQGFVSCTRPPYADECTLAVASTIDRLRAVHAEWSAILSPSHLQQAIGALLNTVIGKMIKDIEDMEDISEPESRRLHQLCEEVSSLQDLFTSRPLPDNQSAPTAAAEQEAGEQEVVSSVAIYVPSWLRFQYLMQILDSSLVDIKYMWTDAGLSLEFSPDEVVDLMKALFAESSHRRSAIAAVKT